MKKLPKLINQSINPKNNKKVKINNLNLKLNLLISIMKKFLLKNQIYQSKKKKMMN